MLKDDKKKNANHIGCGFLACLVVVLVNLSDYFSSQMAHNDSLGISILFASPWVIYPLLTHFDKKKLREQRRISNEKENSLLNVFENEKLILFNSILDSKEPIIDLVSRSNLDLDFSFIENVIESEVESFELSIKNRLINLCGSVDLKQDLLNNSLVDLSVIDNEITQIEMNLPVNACDIVDFVSRKNYLTKKDEKYFTESKRNNLNSYYETQSLEINDILSFGCLNINKISFENEIARINNLKYYSETLDIPFEIEEFEQKYKSFDDTAFEFYNTRVLKNSIYPSFIKKDFELTYKKEAKTLIVDYCLPNIEDISAIKQINKQLNEVEFKEKEINALYENVLYQITLRTIFELFYNDEINFIDSVVFNGWLHYTDKADGNQKTSCILSMQAKKDEFMSIKLEHVEPKVCFKKFKGISCNNLSTITPVRPILFVNKEDKRFIESYEVLVKLNEGINIALMDWQDFENLVREILEKELAEKGCEVKITQSSRDGGVDAIAYNPDPLLGGKIVIQAKRYINVVGVSAVRDLYGTMQHENATRGILVTTSHFGVDSYDFIKDKPITLIEGSNLLHMLEKHGTKARIDIQEARLLKDS